MDLLQTRNDKFSFYDINVYYLEKEPYFFWLLFVFYFKAKLGHFSPKMKNVHKEKLSNLEK